MRRPQGYRAGGLWSEWKVRYLYGESDVSPQREISLTLALRTARFEGQPQIRLTEDERRSLKERVPSEKFKR